MNFKNIYVFGAYLQEMFNKLGIDAKVEVLQSNEDEDFDEDIDTCYTPFEQIRITYNGEAIIWEDCYKIMKEYWQNN